MIKKFKTELLVLASLLFSVFVSYNLDLGLYNYFKEFDKNFGYVYLKEFFVHITVLGDSLWYISFCLFVFVVLFVVQKTNFLKSNKIKTYKNLSIYLLVSLLFCGLITQSLKHIVGRARPNHTNISDSFGFDFFTLDSGFHSFPSGHASTIFVLSLFFSLIIPRLKYFFLAFATIVAFSRVVVGAHFLTDIVGGAVVAVVSFKIINLYLETKKINLKPGIVSYINESLFFSSFVVFLLFASIVTVGPSFDLFFSSIFYLGDSKFILQSYYTITIIFREILIPIILIYLLVLPIVSKIIPIKGLYFGFSFSSKNILYIWTSVFVTLLVFINLFFKVFWGRARPGDVLQLGGKDSFSPWYQISDACSSNCSFVSGDAAVGFSLVVLYFITKNKKYFYFSIICGILLGLIRIAEGGHFLSDVIFSAIIVFLLSFLINKQFFKSIYNG